MISVLLQELMYKLKVSYLLKTYSDFPAIIYLQTMNRCNFRCSMCPYYETTANEPKKTISSDLFEKIIFELSKEKKFVTLTLDLHNEPLLDKNLFYYAKKFKKQIPGKLLEIETNGSLLTKGNIPQLYKYFDNVYISLSAFEGGTYKIVTNRDCFDNVYSALKYISKNKTWRDKTFVRFINQKANAKEKKKFKRYWNKFGFKVICYDMNNRAKNVSNFDKKAPFTSPLKRRMLKLFGRMLLNRCPIPFRFFSICSNGDSILCFNDWSKKNIMGNVHQSTIREIFNSRRYARVRKETKNHSIKNDLCEHCNLYNEGVWMS